MKKINFRKIINARCSALGVTKTELAKIAGIRNATLYDYLAGKSSISSDSLETILNFLSIEIKE